MMKEEVDDFCGDCKRKFNDGEEKVYAGASAKYGDYYPVSKQPICERCSDKRYTEHVRKSEIAKQWAKGKNF